MKKEKFSGSDAVTPISRVLVSGKVGDDSKLEKLNKDAIGKLFNARFAIENSNGETTFGLTDLEEKIVTKADAFVFLPFPPAIKQLHARDARGFFREMFKAASLFVGTQTKDPNLRVITDDEASPRKPIILVNKDDCYKPLMDLAQHMHELGTIRQKPESIFHLVPTVDDAIGLLKKVSAELFEPLGFDAGHQPPHKAKSEERDPQELRKPDFNVCVFCSATTTNEELKGIARNLGRGVASQGWGLISGLGSSGMMGAAVEGAQEIIERLGKGWVAGSNLPRIIEVEGLPKSYDKLWEEKDIYRRMEVMVKNSQAFVVMPGGMGTVQELMGLLLLKHAHDKEKPYLMRDKKFGDKPIILLNHELQVGGGKKFWEPLVTMAKKFGFEKDIVVVDTIYDAMRELNRHHEGKLRQARH